MKVLATGSFDLVHFGHITFLKHASMLGTLHVGLMNDPYIKQKKGNGYPIYPFEHRKGILQSLKFIKSVHLVKGVLPKHVYKNMEMLINHLRIDIIVCGKERTADYWALPLKDKLGITYAILDCEVVHTSNIIRRIQNIENQSN